MIQKLNGRTGSNRIPDRACLNLRRLPARLNVEETAAILGLQVHDIPVLIRAHQLKPLSKPAPNAHKYFAAGEVEELSANPAWLSKATAELASYWQNKNVQKTKPDLAPRGGTVHSRAALSLSSVPG
jgi:hypothetical protein